MRLLLTIEVFLLTARHFLLSVVEPQKRPNPISGRGNRKQRRPNPISGQGEPYAKGFDRTFFGAVADFGAPLKNSLYRNTKHENNPQVSQGVEVEALRESCESKTWLQELSIQASDISPRVLAA